MASQRNIFIKNFFSLTAVETLNKLIPFLIIPYIIQTIGIKKFGLLAFVLSVVQYFKSVSDYGFDLYSTREISKNINNKNKISEVFYTTIFIKIFLAFMLFILLSIIVENFSVFKENSLVFYITYGVIFGYAFLPVWFFQGIEEMKYLTYVVFLSRVLYVFSLLIFVKTESDYIFIPLFESISIILSGIIAFIISIKKFKLEFFFPSKTQILNQLEEGWNLFVLDFVPNLYNNFTTFFLGLVANNSTVGYYTVVYKITSAGIMLINIIRNITFPYLNKNFIYFYKVKNLLLTFGVLLFLIIFLLSDYFVWLVLRVDDEYVAKLLRIMALSSIFVSMMASYGTNYLIIKKYDKVYRKIVFNSSIAGFFMAIILIYFYQDLGAVLTLVGTRLIIALLVYIKYRRYR